MEKIGGKEYFEMLSYRGMQVAVPDHPIIHIDEAELSFDGIKFRYKKVNWKIYKAVFKKYNNGQTRR